jgi:hypothetical protein
LSLRFHPPPVATTPELSWALRRAFGPVEAAKQDQASVDLATAVALAEKLGIAARIGARAHGVAEIDGEAAAALARASRVAAVSEMQTRELAVEVGDAAREVGARCCLLKGAALDARGVLVPGSRVISDVDVLVPEDATAALAAALTRRGFREGVGEEYPHQLAGLIHPTLGLVEIHRHLPGVARPGATRFATFDDLDSAGVLVSKPELGEGTYIPADAALAAHLLAHGIAQHGFQPEAYPGLRMIADLVDLGFAGESGAELLDEALPWIGRFVPVDEARAAAALARRLAAGDVTVDADDDASLLLRHFLAGRLDADYAETLKLVQLAHPLTPASGAARYWSTAKDLLVLSRTQIDLVYGKPRSAWGYLGWRLLRPFDLVRRGARALFASSRH